MINGSLILAGQLLGTAFACGLNLYATIALLGIASRAGWITNLPPGMTGLEHGLVIGSAAALYIVEFAVDRVPHQVPVPAPMGDAIWIDRPHMAPIGEAHLAPIADGAKELTECLRPLSEVGAQGAPDIYEQPFHSLDLVVSQRLGYGFSRSRNGAANMHAVVCLPARAVEIERGPQRRLLQYEE